MSPVIKAKVPRKHPVRAHVATHADLAARYKASAVRLHESGSKRAADVFWSAYVEHAKAAR